LHLQNLTKKLTPQGSLLAAGWGYVTIETKAYKLIMAQDLQEVLLAYAIRATTKSLMIGVP
jgi:hypothetical protein